MNAQGSLLAQVRPSGTSAVTGFTAENLLTELTLIVICNTTGSAANFSIFHDDDGTTFDQSTALVYAKSLAANTYEVVRIASPSSGIMIQPGGSVGVQSGTGNALTFSIYGLTANTAPVVRR